MMHLYGNNSSVVGRLLGLRQAGRRIIIAVDFDNTLYDYHGRHIVTTEIEAIVQRAKAAGCYVIIWTGNTDEELVRTHLAERQVPYDSINEQAPFLPEDERMKRKLYCNLLLDDVAGLESAYLALDDFLNRSGA